MLCPWVYAGVLWWAGAMLAWGQYPQVNTSQLGQQSSSLQCNMQQPYMPVYIHITLDSFQYSVSSCAVGS
jgi:hypothetical protein